MNKTGSKVPVKVGEKASPPATAGAVQPWRPLENLRREVDRLFADFDRGFGWPSLRRSIFDIEPFWRGETVWSGAPAVDIVEKDGAFEVRAEVPGMEEKDVEVTLAGGTLTIKGEKQEAKEEKKKGYHLQERRFGSFERSFRLPDTVDADKAEASFAKGILTVTLPKKPEAQRPARKLKIKSA